MFNKCFIKGSACLSLFGNRTEKALNTHGAPDCRGGVTAVDPIQATNIEDVPIELIRIVLLYSVRYNSDLLLIMSLSKQLKIKLSTAPEFSLKGKYVSFGEYKLFCFNRRVSNKSLSLNRYKNELNKEVCRLENTYKELSETNLVGHALFTPFCMIDRASFQRKILNKKLQANQQKVRKLELEMSKLQSLVIASKSPPGFS